MKTKLLILFTLFYAFGYSQLTSEGFEGTWTAGSGPTGWSIINVAGPAVMWEQSSNGAYQGSKAAYLNKEDVATGTVAEDWFISPSFIVPENGQLKFYSRLTIDGDQGTIYKAMIGTNPADMTSFVPLQTWTELEINPVQQEYNDVTVNIPAANVGQTRYIAFIMMGDDADRWYIDNVSVLPVCETPTYLTVTNITATSAQLGWTTPGDATTWEIELLPANAVPQGVGTVASTNPFYVTGLSPGNYKYYVRSVCGPNNVSAWAGPMYFSTVTGNMVTGTARYDTNGDGICNTQDNVLTSMQVVVSVNGEEPFSVYTNAQGQYTVYNLPSAPSTITLLAVAPAAFTAIEEATTQTIAYNGSGNSITIDLCLPAPATVVNDLSVSLIPVSDAKPGFLASYKLIVLNNGAAALTNAVAAIQFNDSEINFYSSDGTFTVSGNTISYAIGGVAPFSTTQYSPVFSVLAPPVNVGGESLGFTANVTMAETDAAPVDNTAEYNQTIVNSFDPNDITVAEGDVILEEQAGNYLTYTIRFQNTGTAAATNVRLTNELDEQFDFNTFQPINASHAYTVTRTGNMLEFNYANINLADSTSNEAASHGYIAYRVKPKSTFGIGDTVYNTANIYFDFNPAIVTNTASTSVYALLGTNTNTLTNITLYPNPVNDVLHINTVQGNLQSVAVYDLNGRLCLTSGSQNTLNTQALGAGLYIVKVVTDKGGSSFKLVKR